MGNTWRGAIIGNSADAVAALMNETLFDLVQLTCREVRDFFFEVRTPQGGTLQVTTEPVDETRRQLRILRVEVKESAVRRRPPKTCGGTRPAGCESRAMASGDPKQMEAHSSAYFEPLCWEIGRRLEWPRYILVRGICNNCGKELSTGLLLPADAENTEFYTLVYDALLQFRPYRAEGVKPKDYGDTAQRREYWYRQQDRQSEQTRGGLFRSLFPEEERGLAAEWLTQYLSELDQPAT